MSSSGGLTPRPGLSLPRRRFATAPASTAPRTGGRRERGSAPYRRGPFAGFVRAVPASRDPPSLAPARPRPPRRPRRRAGRARERAARAAGPPTNPASGRPVRTDVREGCRGGRRPGGRARCRAWRPCALRIVGQGRRSRERSGLHRAGNSPNRAGAGRRSPVARVGDQATCGRPSRGPAAKFHDRCRRTSSPGAAGRQRAPFLVPSSAISALIGSGWTGTVMFLMHARRRSTNTPGRRLGVLGTSHGWTPWLAGRKEARARRAPSAMCRRGGGRTTAPRCRFLTSGAQAGPMCGGPGRERTPGGRMPLPVTSGLDGRNQPILGSRRGPGSAGPQGRRAPCVPRGTRAGRCVACATAR